MVRRPELLTGRERRGEALWAARRERRAYREGVERRKGAGWCWWEHRERRGGGGGAPWRPAKAEEVPAKSTGLFAGKLPTKSTGVEELRRRTAAAGSGESEAESGGGGKSRIV